MPDELFRRQFLKAGVGFIAGAGSTVLFSDFTAVLAQSTGQRDWRFCHKCQSMFFDGYPNKGTCAAGGAHEAAGFNFVLPHETDYPGKVSNLLIQPNSMQNVVNMVWNEAGRGIAAEQVRQSINGRKFAEGVSGYDANVNMGNITATWNKTAPNQLSMEVRLPGNNVEFHTTTPTVIGSWGDPAFRVGFDILVNLASSVNNSSTPIIINQLNAQVTNASIHGSNASGTLVETLADFFTGGNFSRSITNSINNDIDLKNQVAQAITSVLSRVW